MRVDRTRKVPVTVLIRALGFGTNAQIRELFGDEPKIEASIAKDPSVTEKSPNGGYEEGLLELYKKSVRVNLFRLIVQRALSMQCSLTQEDTTLLR